MFIIENIRLAFGALVNNKMRSLLTMLGIIIGISSVITITTIGSSLKTTLANTIMSTGNNGFYLNYQMKPDEDGNYDYTRQITPDDYCSPEMLNELEKRFEGKYLICKFAALGAGTLRNSKNQQLNVSLSGMSEGYMQAQKTVLRLIGGRYLNDVDSNRHKHACIVSDVFVQQYFLDGSDPIGKSISLDIHGLCSTDFVIVGVYKFPASFEKMMDPGTPLMDRTTEIYVPYQVALDITNQKDSSSKYPQINVRGDSYDKEACMAELQAFFDEVSENKNVMYIVRSDQDDMEQINMILTIITVVISIIAAISLLVGGIGVMNIMLVSITERTREIGVRKAIGAKSTTIRNQFLIESIIMCLTGGGIGITIGIVNGLLVGIIGSKLLRHFFPLYADLVTINIKPSFVAIFISVVFSLLIGLFFGTYPASKAAKMNPIDALRYE